jgi:hypothetical protein
MLGKEVFLSSFFFLDRVAMFPRLVFELLDAGNTPASAFCVA